MNLRLPLALAAAALAAAACSDPPASTPTPTAISVTAEPVVMGQVQKRVEAVGRVRATESVDIQARVTGFLGPIGFQFGSKVEKGKPLFEIQKDEFQAAVDSANAQVKSSEATHEQALQYLERLKSVRDGGVAPNEIENARLEAKRMEGMLDAARAELKRSELQLSYCDIAAPISGRIGRPAFTAGNLVSPQSGTLVTIHQQDPIEASFVVPENVFVASEIARLGKGISEEEAMSRVSFNLRLADGSDYEAEGTVSFLDTAVDPNTGTITLRAKFANPDGILLPGQYVTVLVGLGKEESAPVIPRTAVLRDRSGATVILVGPDGTAQRREVELGPDVGRKVAVISGVSVGDMVVTEGLDRIRPGAKLEIAQTATAN